MFFGRAWRQKRQVLLSRVRAAEKTPPPMSWHPPAHNVPGQENCWYRSVFLSHGAFCGCGDFVGHLVRLSERLGRPAPPRPPGGPQGATLRALPAPPEQGSPSGERRHSRTENQPCRGAGGGDAGDGAPGDGGAAGEPDEFGDEDVGDLLDLLDAPE